jgi:hypothetical protein
MRDGCSHSWAEDGPELICAKCGARIAPSCLTEQPPADEAPALLTRGLRRCGPCCPVQQLTREQLPPDFQQLLAQIEKNERTKG